MIRGLQAALKGVLSAQERLAESAQTVSQGDISPEALVETERQVQDVRVQTKNLREMMKAEKSLLDILA